jgi:hypothetical protein
VIGSVDVTHLAILEERFQVIKKGHLGGLSSEIYKRPIRGYSPAIRVAVMGVIGRTAIRDTAVLVDTAWRSGCPANGAF